ncbi:Pinopsin [Trichoplax sp. H2]|nr:Pinopsin [Trichoplax sp. H2]|eukprot:RDD36768.1 Pinopsin [Trichoplax sp. H2]
MQTNTSLDAMNFSSILNVLPPSVVASLTFACVAITFNIFVIAILLRLQISGNVLNLLIMSLAMSDLFSSISVIIGSSLSIIGSITTIFIYSKWAAMNIICKLNSFLAVSTSYSATLTLTILAIERYRVICFPMNIRREYRHYFIAIIGIWLFSFAVSSYMVISYQSIPFHPYLCYMSGSNYIGNNVWLIASGVTCYLLPNVITIFCYVMIVLKLCRRKLPGDSVTKQSSYTAKRRKEIISVASLLIITVLSAFSNCAYHLYLIITLIKISDDVSILTSFYTDFKYHDITFLQISIFITILQSGLDPILYNFVSSKFRSSVRKLLCSYLKH